MLGTGFTATFCKIAIPAQLHVIAFLLVTSSWHLMRSIYSTTVWTYTCFCILFYDTFFLSRLPSLPCMHISTHQLRDCIKLQTLKSLSTSQLLGHTRVLTLGQHVDHDIEDFFNLPFYQMCVQNCFFFFTFY